MLRVCVRTTVRSNSVGLQSLMQDTLANSALLSQLLFVQRFTSVVNIMKDMREENMTNSWTAIRKNL